MTFMFCWRIEATNRTVCHKPICISYLLATQSWGQL